MPVEVYLIQSYTSSTRGFRFIAFNLPISVAELKIVSMMVALFSL